MEKQNLLGQATQIFSSWKNEPYYSFADGERGVFIPFVIMLVFIGAAWLVAGFSNGIAIGIASIAGGGGGGRFVLGGAIMLAFGLAILVVGLMVEWHAYQNYQVENKAYKAAKLDSVLDNDVNNPLLEAVLIHAKKEEQQAVSESFV